MSRHHMLGISDKVRSSGSALLRFILYLGDIIYMFYINNFYLNFIYLEELHLLIII